jgi:O-antigen ligase
MNKYLEISRFIYIFGLVILPLFLSPFSETPYTLSKTFLIALVSLLSGLFFILSNTGRFLFPNNYVNLFFLFDIVQGLFVDSSLLFPRYSEHYLVSINIYIFIFLGINLFKNLDLEKPLFYSSIFVIFISFFELFINEGRLIGTLGQSNFLGIFLVLSILSVLNNLKNYTTQQIIIYTLLSTMLIIKTASLAAVFSLIIGLFILRDKIIKLGTKIIFFGIVLISLIILFFGQIYINKSIDIFNQIFKPRETIISDSFLIRVKIWELTSDVIFSSPVNAIFGFGSNNFEVFFEKVRNNNLSLTSESKLFFDKPHNYFLEILFNKGLVGLVLFLLIVYRTVRFGRYLKYIFIPILFFLFFNWLDIYLKILFFFIAALNLSSVEIKIENEKLFKIILTILLIFTFYFFGSYFYRDTKSFYGNNQYIFSETKEDVLNFKYSNPIFLINSTKYMSQEESRKIFDFLIKNFPNNEALLFHSDKLL